ncbi:hypothetical protein GOP47_0003467 [Adiantum capillus-veneris]|uniref:START domain-containing protein n=1 Tax=Adiantum capillus-veneris TaxID=13818 RepID=A0A9D4ZQ33_ADICA|nr:hypothetical protein GOP47_0003467 [Adiantum capillus-veneris]
MFADIQVPSPIVPTHQVYFLSSYKMVSEGTWAAVDVSVDNLPGDLPSIAHKCRKRPAGCLIQLLPNGLSKVSHSQRKILMYVRNVTMQQYKPSTIPSKKCNNIFSDNLDRTL